MKTLPKTFKKWGDNFELKKKGKKCAIYKRVSDTGALHWEVLGYQIVKEKIDTGYFVVEPGEHLQMADQNYGVVSFCFLGIDEEGAVDKFNKIENEE